MQYTPHCIAGIRPNVLNGYHKCWKTPVLTSQYRPLLGTQSSASDISLNLKPINMEARTQGSIWVALLAF